MQPTGGAETRGDHSRSRERGRPLSQSASGARAATPPEFDPSAKACLFAGDHLVLPEGAAELPSLNEARSWRVGDCEWFPVGCAGDRAAQAIDGPAAGGCGSGPLSGQTRTVAAQAASRWKAPAGTIAVGMRQALMLLQEPDLSLALTAAHLARWRRTSRHCGVCGAPTRESRRHQAMVCPSCAHLAFPKVSPAVIVQVTRGSRILLGRSRRHPSGSYSVLAGFVDPGESLEDTVRREVEEESGVRVRNIRYFGSQPWPFPDSLMVGFTAAYDGGALVRGDGELEDLGWFAADALPPVPPSYSIARALIDDFAARHGVDPAGIPTWRRPSRDHTTPKTTEDS